MKTLLFSLLLALTVSTFAQTPAPEATGTDGTLTVSVTTASAGGGYSPEHVLAIWVQNSTGTLINTMMYYTNNGNSSASDMSKWYALIGSRWSTTAATLATYTLKNVDGISGATQKSGTYGVRTCYWGKTVSLAAVADGTYTVGMELNDDATSVNTTGHRYATFSFTKGAAAQTLNPTDVLPSFKSISIKWVPKSTGINDVKLADQYSVYPNPTRATAYVSGFDISEIQLCTLAGKHLFTTNEQSLNLSALPKGIYLAKVTTKNGTFVKKIEKL